jgi:hypothetical protein
MTQTRANLFGAESGSSSLVAPTASVHDDELLEPDGDLRMGMV